MNRITWNKHQIRWQKWPAQRRGVHENWEFPPSLEYREVSLTWANIPNISDEFPYILNYHCRVVFTFDNLFNGDQTLGRDTNQFLNDNWRDIFDEIKKPIYDGISAAAERTLTKMMNEVPYKDLFVWCMDDDVRS